MTLSRKKRAAKEQARIQRREALNAPRYRNRRFPDGTVMTPDEAICEFPPLKPASRLFEGNIPTGCNVLVEYSSTAVSFRFWLSDVIVSIVSDEYRGYIADEVPRNDAGLAWSQWISFERRHVISIPKLIAGKPNSASMPMLSNEEVTELAVLLSDQ